MICLRMCAYDPLYYRKNLSLQIIFVLFCFGNPQSLFMKYVNSFLLAFLCLLIFSFDLSSQDPTDFDAFQYRCVGPTRGGRVTTVAGTANQPGTFYMGVTGGGVWKTTDFGTSWRNVSDGYFATPSIGAIRVAPSNPEILYVGTGSDGLRSNVITGKGIYKSSNGGKNWLHIGLKETGHIGAVEVHPTNPDVVFVAAIGQGFEANKDRGVFRTQNGGNTWDKVLYLNDTIGFADLEFLPGNPNVIYAAAWRAERKPWTIISGGKEGGIYKSMDGGDNWSKLGNGLPKGIIGKIDLAVCPAKPNLLYALIEAGNGEEGLYRSNDQGKSFNRVSKEKGLLDRPFYYNNIEVDPQNPEIVYALSTRFYKSTDGGKKWKQLIPPHGDNHDMWINPDNPQLFIQANDGGANVTHNGGKTWSTQLNQPTAELYQVEVDDQYPYWLYAGQQDNYTTISVPSLPPKAHQAGNIGLVVNTGGCETGPAVPKPGNANIVYSNCKGRFSVFNKITGQEKSYNVGSANMYGHNPRDLKFRFQRVSPIHVSPHNPNVIYHTSQFVHKTTNEGKSWEIISPDLTAFESDKQVISGSPITRDITGEEFYSTIYAIQESKLQAGLIWVGANDGPVHVTRNGGKKWSKVTPPDLKPGGRVDCVEPSPHSPSKAYISVLRYQLGDWKPYIYRTNDYGKNWTLLTTGSNGIPADFPTRVVREDPNQEGILYAGTEFGLFISFDDGKTWQSFQQNLPITPITDLKIHRGNLVLSTMGRSFWILDNITSLSQKFLASIQKKPTLFKPKDTYNYRYRTQRNQDTSLIAYEYPAPSVIIDYYLPAKAKQPLQLEILNNKGTVIRSYNSKSDTIQHVSSNRDMATNIRIETLKSKLKAGKGLHRFRWDLRHQGPWDKNKKKRYQNGAMVSPGKYKVRLTIDGQAYEQEFAVLLDPRITESGTTLQEIQAQEKLNLAIISLLSKSRKMATKVQEARKALKKKSKSSGLIGAEKEQDLQYQFLEEKLVTAKMRYPQPMLIDQINYLYGLLNRSDQAPGKDAIDRFAELKSQFEALSTKGGDLGSDTDR